MKPRLFISVLIKQNFHYQRQHSRFTKVNVQMKKCSLSKINFTSMSHIYCSHIEQIVTILVCGFCYFIKNHFIWLTIHNQFMLPYGRALSLYRNNSILFCFFFCDKWKLHRRSMKYSQSTTVQKPYNVH